MAPAGARNAGRGTLPGLAFIQERILRPLGKADRLLLEHIVPWARGVDAPGYRLPRGRPFETVTAGAWPEIVLRPDALARYTGAYEENGQRIEVWEEEGVLRMTPLAGDEGGPLHIFPLGDHVFGFGLYEAARLVKVYWPNIRLEFGMRGDRAVRYQVRTAGGHVYTSAERIR